MSTLLSFPNELLDHIINDIHIDDIEAFSSCCKQIKLLAAARLEKHLVRKFSFPAVAIIPTRPGQFVEGTVLGLIPTRLLQDFLMDEENTLYPCFMDIGVIHDNDDFKFEDQRRAYVTTYLEQHDGLEEKIVAKVMQIHRNLFREESPIEAQDWIDRIKKGDPHAIAALLITLFPNVKTLVIFSPGHLGPDSLLMRTLQRLALAAAKNDPRALDVFSELSKIDLQGSRGNGINGNLIAPFMILPSMRFIKGCGMWWDCIVWPYGSVMSSVKEISLHCSTILPETWVDCLGRIETLERFIYDHEGPSMLWGPRLIVKALRKYAQRSLVHLELTLVENDLHLEVAGAEPLIGTLRSFERLESIRLMTMMLFKQIDGEDIDESEDIMTTTSENVVHPESMVEPRRLVDFLPSSARKLELVGGLSDEEARDMFEDLPKLKRERLPNLCEIVLEDSDILEQETKNLCKEAGIRLKSIKRVVNRYQRIYTITKPAPQVELSNASF